MKKGRILTVFAISLVVAFVFSTPALARPEFFAIATGGTGGTYYPLGGVLAQALSKNVPKVIVTAQSGNASVANCNLIKEHEIESAFVQNNVAFAAYKGRAQFKGNPIQNIRGIASLYPETIQIVARADAGVKTTDDMKGKRLVPGDRGSGAEVDCKSILKSHGLNYKDFKSVDWLSFSGASQRLKDKQADLAFITAGWPTASITELATQTGVNLVSIKEDHVKKLIKMFPFYSKIVIPANTYPGVGKDTTTITTMAQWIVDEKVSEKTVYLLTKALWEGGSATMANAHAKGKEVTLETALNGMAIPLHPGAEKYYREKGVLK
ncbi:MAG: TAXI family TRAP transporter solute-binding subunit [Desulfobacteraceae bacterium]|nr:TAXI family TRAP transporter solute-binding subunit [Desulfobacteraceae bacterium]